MLGRFLFRWRGVIGVLAFGVVFWLARPTFGSCLLGVPFLLLGLAVRFWASGYIGMEGRAREIGGQREQGGRRREVEGAPRRRIVSGPYRLLRHPLYIGNFLLVLGVLVALRPALWLSAVVLMGFVAEYGLIVAAEERDLRQEWPGGPVVNRSGADLPDADGAGRHAPGESFSFGRAMCEWRTWVAVGAAWGLAVVKALATN